MTWNPPWTQLTGKAPNTTIDDIANTVDPDETAIMGRLIWIYSVCPLVFDFSTKYSSVYWKFLKRVQM